MSKQNAEQHSLFSPLQIDRRSVLLLPLKAAAGALLLKVLATEPPALATDAPPQAVEEVIATPTDAAETITSAAQLTTLLDEQPNPERITISLELYTDTNAIEEELRAIFPLVQNHQYPIILETLRVPILEQDSQKLEALLSTAHTFFAQKVECVADTVEQRAAATQVLDAWFEQETLVLTHTDTGEPVLTAQSDPFAHQQVIINNDQFGLLLTDSEGKKMQHQQVCAVPAFAALTALGALYAADVAHTFVIAGPAEERLVHAEYTHNYLYQIPRSTENTSARLYTELDSPLDQELHGVMSTNLALEPMNAATISQTPAPVAYVLHTHLANRVQRTKYAELAPSYTVDTTSHTQLSTQADTEQSDAASVVQMYQAAQDVLIHCQFKTGTKARQLMEELHQHQPHTVLIQSAANDAELYQATDFQESTAHQVVLGVNVLGQESETPAEPSPSSGVLAATATQYDGWPRALATQGNQGVLSVEHTNSTNPSEVLTTRLRFNGTSSATPQLAGYIASKALENDQSFITATQAVLEEADIYTGRREASSAVNSQHDSIQLELPTHPLILTGNEIVSTLHLTPAQQAQLNPTAEYQLFAEIPPQPLSGTPIISASLQDYDSPVFSALREASAQQGVSLPPTATALEYIQALESQDTFVPLILTSIALQFGYIEQLQPALLPGFRFLVQTEDASTLFSISVSVAGLRASDNQLIATWVEGWEDWQVVFSEITIAGNSWFSHGYVQGKNYHDFTICRLQDPDGGRHTVFLPLISQ